MSQTTAVDRVQKQQAFANLPTDYTQRRISINVVNERITTVIASGSRMTGDLQLKEGIKIDGDLCGTLTFGLDDGLGIISRYATVQGDVYGPRALIMGTVEGDLHIHGLVVLAPTAMILGNVYYDRIMVYDGAQISGALKMNSTRSLAHGFAQDSQHGNVVRDFKSVAAR